MGDWIRAGLAGLALLLASGPAAGAPAAARPRLIDEGPLKLTLLCKGSDSAMMMMMMPGGSRKGRMARARRVSAQMGVIIDGTDVHVRPPATSMPMMPKKTDDGWFEVKKVEITAGGIRGKAVLGGMVSSKLDIDRRTGTITFGEFNGACRPVATTTDGTVF